MDFPVYTNIINLFFFSLLSSLILLLILLQKTPMLTGLGKQDSESSKKKKLTAFDSNVHLGILRNDNMHHLGLQNLRT